MNIREFLRSPATDWALWILQKVRLEGSGKVNRLGYLSKATNCEFEGNNSIFERATLANVSLGRFSYIGHDCHISNTWIGKFCSIAPWTKAGLGKHPSRDFATSHPLFYSSANHCGLVLAQHGEWFQEVEETRIGNDVWIGAGAILMDGITIGDGAIVGSGAVVTRDVPPFTIVGGIPAKTIRARFSEEDVEFLSAIRWWDKDISWLRENWKSLHDMRTLKKKFGSEFGLS